MALFIDELVMCSGIVLSASSIKRNPDGMRQLKIETKERFLFRKTEKGESNKKVEICLGLAGSLVVC
jgi:hypothetical protein